MKCAYCGKNVIHINEDEKMSCPGISRKYRNQRDKLREFADWANDMLAEINEGEIDPGRVKEFLRQYEIMCKIIDGAGI